MCACPMSPARFGLLMSGEDQISTFKEGSEQYPVTMRLMPGQRDDPAALSRLLVPSAKQGLIRLDSIAKLERGLGPSRIDRYNRQFAVGIYGNVPPGHSLGRGRRSHAGHHQGCGYAARLQHGVLRPGEDPGRDDHEHAAGVRAWPRSSCTWCSRRNSRAWRIRSSFC